MYLDKLDGRITPDEFNRLAGAWRSELQQLEHRIKDQEATELQAHLGDGIELLKLAQNAGNLFEMQPARGKRRLLNIVVSNSRWKD